MMSYIHILKGAIISIYPMLANTLMNMFGFRGTLLILSPISSHVVPGMIAMHPIRWHYKVVKTIEEELSPLMEKNSNENGAAITITSTDENAKCAESTEKCKVRKISDENGSKPIDEISEPVDSQIQSKEIDSIQNQSGTNITDVVPAKVGICQRVVDLLDLTLLKDAHIILGITCGHIADNMLVSLLPMYLSTLGFSMNDSALVLSMETGANMAARITLAAVSSFIQFKSRHVFLPAMVALIFIRIVLLNVFSFSGIMITILHVVTSLILAENLPPERFASGYGFYMIFQGTFTFFVSPVLGWIRDKTQSFVVLINCFQCLALLCVIPWIVEIIWLRVVSKKTKNNQV